MTEQEAMKIHVKECNHRIGIINEFLRTKKNIDDETVSECNENIEILKTAITALEEIQQYRAIGTVEEITEINDFFKTQTAKILAKLQEYEITGFTPQEIMDGKMLVGWIPIEEKLPKTQDGYAHVMVSMDDGFVCTTDYTDNDGFELWADSGEVLAWTPLPEPYEPDAELAEMGGEL